MRLYLSSFQLGNSPEALLDLLGPNRHVALIANAADTCATLAERATRVARQVENMASLGLSCEEVDLRQYFSQPNELAHRMKRFGLVWVSGGNCFVLKRALVQSGFGPLIHDMLVRDEIVYGAYSAGVMMVMPTLKGIDLCDDSAVVPAGYQPNVSWDGLGLIDYSIVPHYRSDHPESAIMEDVVTYLERERLPYKTLRDGEAVVVNGEKSFVSGIMPSTP